jgi:hypothetical protein
LREFARIVAAPASQEPSGRILQAEGPLITGPIPVLQDCFHCQIE